MYFWQFEEYEEAFAAELSGYLEAFENITFQKQSSVREKTTSLKKVFDSIHLLAMREINEARIFYADIPDVTERVSYLLDLIKDPYHPDSISLVKNGMLRPAEDGLRTIWADLAQYRDQKIESINKAIVPLLQIESAMNERATNITPLQPHSTHSDTGRLRIQEAEPERRIVHVPTFLGHPLRPQAPEQPFRTSGAQIFQHPRARLVL